MENKTKKQRLDAYVQAAMTGMLSGADVNSTCTYDNIHYAAQRMMDYVDAQQVEVELGNVWTKNQGAQPVEDKVLVEVRLYNGKEHKDYSDMFYWATTDAGDAAISTWRKAQ